VTDKLLSETAKSETKRNVLRKSARHTEQNE